MIEKTEEMNALLDFYDSLLTEKQLNVMNLYYKEDFSLAEIAEEMNISRAAVSDHLKRSMQILEDYESKLKLVQKYEKRIIIYDKIKEINNQKVNVLIERLEQIDN